jgi:beta-mannosidase
MPARLLQEWSFTQVGGGEGTKDGEWLQTSEFPTSVHVELLNLKRIPDPVRIHPAAAEDAD